MVYDARNSEPMLNRKNSSVGFCPEGTKGLSPGFQPRVNCPNDAPPCKGGRDWFDALYLEGSGTLYHPYRVDSFK